MIKDLFDSGNEFIGRNWLAALPVVLFILPAVGFVIVIGALKELALSLSEWDG